MPKKQSDLPEMEGEGVTLPSIPEIDDAADAYIALRDKRIALLAKELAAKEELRNLMHSNKLKRYNYDDRIVELVETTEKVKVKKAKDEDEEDDDE